MRDAKFVRKIAALLFLLMTIILFLLVREYLFFKQEVRQLRELQHVYQLSLAALQRESDRGENDSFHCWSEEKKKELTEQVALWQNGSAKQLLLINREPDYLRQATVEYIKEQNLEPLLQRINFDDLLDYNDHLTQCSQQDRQGSKKRYAKVRTRKKSERKRSAVRSTKRRSLGSSRSDIIFCWPIERKQFWISSFFGPRRKPNGSWGFHQGLDLAAVRGTLVHASRKGVVEEAGYRAGYGKTVVIAHEGNYKTRYAHLDTITVSRGQAVTEKTSIGQVGDTGFVRKSGTDASHLHFEISLFGKRINPIYFLR